MAGGFYDNVRRLLGWWSSAPVVENTIFGESVEFRSSRLRAMEATRERAFDGDRLRLIFGERSSGFDADRTRQIDHERLP